MKKALSLILAFSMLLSLFLGYGGACAAADTPEEEKDLIILFTSDIHCGIKDGWGFAGLCAIKENLEKDYNVLLVDDGDAIQGEPIGTMTRGQGIIDIMNTLGYVAATPGNHEFDYGMDRFLELTETADFPYISCNFNKNGELVFEPWILKEVGGMKIGFVGVTTPYTIRTSTPRYFMDEDGNYIYGFFEDETGETLCGKVQQAVDEVREAGADYVVVLGHVGNKKDTGNYTYDYIISHVSGIDAFLDGHSHDTDQVVMKDKDGKDVVRSGCGTKLGSIGALHITREGEISSELFTWNSSIPAAELLGIENIGSKAVEEAFEVLDAKLEEVVAKTNVDLVIYDPEAVKDDGKPVRIIRNAETNLGDLCADAYLFESGEADIAFVNGGGIRTNIDKGDITLNDILKVHPFGNSLTVIEVTGQQVLDALEWSVHLMPKEFGGFDQVAGLTFEYDATIESPCIENSKGFFDGIDETMERRVRNVVVGGEPLDPAGIYKLVSSDYQLLNEGDGYTMYKGAEVLQNSVKLDNQVLIDYIVDVLGGTIGAEYAEPYGLGRIVSVGEE